jgi:hypothetical protein
MSSLKAYVLLADNRLLLVAADGTIRQVADVMDYSASDSFRSTGRFLVGRAPLFTLCLRPERDQVPLPSSTSVPRALSVF